MIENRGSSGYIDENKDGDKMSCLQSCKGSGLDLLPAKFRNILVQTDLPEQGGDFGS